MTLHTENSNKSEYARPSTDPKEGKVPRRSLDIHSLDTGQDPEQNADQTPGSIGKSVPYPLLESLLRQKGLSLKGIYTVPDVAMIFDVSKRTIQDWGKQGKLIERDLPGRGRFLSEDLELLFHKSKKEPT